MSLTVQGFQNLTAGILIFVGSPEGPGYEQSVVFTHTTGTHACVLGFDHHRDAAGLENLVYGYRNLRCQTLLDLETPRICIDQTSEFRYSDNTVPGQVSNMCNAADSGHVMFTGGLERDVSQQNHLVIIGYFAKCTLKDSGRYLRIAGKPFLVGTDDPRWSVGKPFACRVVASPVD